LQTPGYDWSVHGLYNVQNGKQTPSKKCCSGGVVGVDSSRCLVTNEEDASSGRSLSVGADNDDSRSVGLPDSVAADESLEVSRKHSSTKTENQLACQDIGRTPSPDERAIAARIRGSNANSPSAAGQLMMLLASQDADNSSVSMAERSGLQE